MTDFDKYLRKKAKEERSRLPSSARKRVEQTLASLPESKRRPRAACVFSRMAAAAACFFFITLFLLPNVSVAYAQALENIPLIGDIVKVVTLRNYFYSDPYHEMDIHIPKIEDEASEAAEQINKDITEFTDELVHRFYKDLEVVGKNGHGSIYVDYETLTNTPEWFTLKLRVHEAAGSSNTYFKYYHIHKASGQIVCLGSLAADDRFYEVLTAEIKRQMRLQMKQDSHTIYWLEDSVIGKNLVFLNENHNFYWNENGDLVIPFDKYEVAPGAMGTPEFTIDKDILKDIIQPEFLDILS
ncbi:MAG: DUF3298 domain-containing protein [Lachnospiraceae bacterium]|nr:DUF3298 domain-containing protein [Lachnospiraceae bacterium]